MKRTKTQSKPRRAPAKSVLGGAHPESAVLKDLLCVAGVTVGKTKKPLSEAMCFGIAGGVASGFADVPELRNAGLGSGIAFVGRHRQFQTDARWHTEFCRRLEIRCLAIEEPQPQRARDNLVAGSKGGRPLIAWCSPVLFPQLSWATTAGMYTLLVHSVDERKQKVVVSDAGPKTFVLTLEDFAAIRGRVNPLQNRLLLVDPPERVEPEAVATAALAGIKACVNGARDLDQRGHRAQPIAECAAILAQHHHSQGWRSLFPAGRLHGALADAWQSLGAGGGGFFRALFADFLDETAALAERPALAECAAAWRGFAERWTALASTLLPRRLVLFRRTCEALVDVERLYLAKGRAADDAILARRAALADLDKVALERFPLDGHSANRLLEEFAGELAALAADESAAVDLLRDAAR